MTHEAAANESTDFESTCCAPSATFGGILDVVIAVSGRPEVAGCIGSLLQVGPIVRSVIVIDTSKSRPSWDQYEDIPSSNIIKYDWAPKPGFSKAASLNRGIGLATSRLILVSDADILWNAAAIHALARAILDDGGSEIICSVSVVEETDRGSVALRRKGFEYRVLEQQGRLCATIGFRTPDVSVRTGPGLVMAKAATWHKLGGYADDFIGWGWEDQDLLMRAELSGIRHVKLGRVRHQSHGDAVRNVASRGIDPAVTRNRNILRSVARIRSGDLLGALKPEFDGEPLAPSPIAVSFEEGVEAELIRDQ